MAVTFHGRVKFKNLELVNIGDSTTANVYTAGSPPMSFYFTNSGTTSTNAEPFYLKSVMTGVGGYGGRARFHTYTNVALTTNVMAIKALLEFGESGNVSGLAAGLCTEVDFGAATTGGTFAGLENELVFPSGATCPSLHTAFFYLGATGDGVATFNTNGVLFELEGLTGASGKILYNNTLRCNVGGTTWYLPMSSAEGSYTTAYPVSLSYNGAALVLTGTARATIGTSGTPLALTAGSPIVSVYSTCAGVSGSTSAEPVIFDSVMTGAGQVGGRVLVNMTTAVQLGSYANAFKAQVNCSTNGGSSGLLAAACFEMVFPTGTDNGYYTILELEANCPTGWNGTAAANGISYMRCSQSGLASSNWDTAGNLFEIYGYTAASGKFVYGNTVRVSMGGTAYYLPLSTGEATYAATFTGSTSGENNYTGTGVYGAAGISIGTVSSRNTIASAGANAAAQFHVQQDILMSAATHVLSGIYVTASHGNVTSTNGAVEAISAYARNSGTGTCINLTGGLFMVYSGTSNSTKYKKGLLIDIVDAASSHPSGGGTQGICLQLNPTSVTNNQVDAILINQNSAQQTAGGIVFNGKMGATSGSHAVVSFIGAADASNDEGNKGNLFKFRSGGTSYVVTPAQFLTALGANCTSI